MADTSHDEVVDATVETELDVEPQQVPVNVYETTDALVVVAPLPAVAPDDVTIEIEDGTLHVWSHLRSAAPRDYLLHEWDYGNFERRLQLPDGFGVAAEASLANGQLAIRVLRGEATAPLRFSPTR